MTIREAMSLAIEEGSRGAGWVSPNPQVGCVVLNKSGSLIAKGHHKKFGGPHAEVWALREVPTASDLEGATVVVTLEPCSHEGKTPSCAKALARLPIGRVVYGLIDPNPKVSGQGLEILRAAGIKTECATELFPELLAPLEELCEHFLFNQRMSLPFVSLKVATSLDGVMALKTGESQWITGPTSREKGHYLRAIHEAILVGSGTVLADNPRLNVRIAGFECQPPNRVIVLDRRGRLTKDIESLALARNRKSSEIILVKASENLTHRQFLSADNKFTVLEVPAVTEGHFLVGTLNALFNLGIHSILVEGGRQILTSFLTNRMAQRLYLFQSPTLLGGANGQLWTAGLQTSRLAEGLSLKNVDRHNFGEDQLVTGLFCQQSD